MKPAQVNKLYRKLTPHEQAALVLEAAARLDEKEVDAILEQVEHKTYLTVHANYHRRAYGLMSLVGQYGIEYWKSRALMLTALNVCDDNETAFKFLAKLGSMEAALMAVCERLKVDVEAVKTLADCKDGPAFNAYAEAEQVEQYLEVFSKVAQLGK